MNKVVKGWGFVAIQMVCLVVLAVWAPTPDWSQPGWVSSLGMVLVVAGFGYVLIGSINLGPASITATPVPRDSARLTTVGLYRFSRHPLYTGVLTIALGLVMRRASFVAMAVGAALFLLLWQKAKFEESLLKDRYPEYGDYAAKTPRFVPRFF